MNMARLWRGILLFLAGFSFFIVKATTKKPSSNLIKTQAEPGKQSEEHFHEVSVDQEHGGKESSKVDQ